MNYLYFVQNKESSDSYEYVCRIKCIINKEFIINHHMF